MRIPEEEVALIEDCVGDSVDHRGFPASKSTTGGWRSAWYIIGEEWKLERDLRTLGLPPTELLEMVHPRHVKDDLTKALQPGEEGVEPCDARDVEDVMTLVRLIPIWITSVVSTIPYAQYATFFTKQAVTVDRNILPGLEIPPASLHAFIGVSILISVPTYEGVFLPLARLITKKPSGITMLQRIGAVIWHSSLHMVDAALVETKRLEIAKEHGLLDRPDVTIPMSIWWFVPQYLLLGMIDVFSLVGTQEFFYDQVPTKLRSIGLALSLSAIGLASFLSGFLITVITWATGKYGGESWFNINLNRAHVDYFYWLLAALTAIGFFAFLFFSRLYVYRRVDQV